MWSELFLVPFLTGLVLAAVLPLLGAYLRLRDEWLAALAYAHVSAGGALLALVAGLPPAAGGVGAALAAGAGKRVFAARLSGGASYALLFLGGWSVAVLMAANHPLAERLGHALFDGQLYFSDVSTFLLVAAGGAISLFALRLISRNLLLAHLYPDFFRISGLRAWPTQVGFDVMAALCLALATMSLGVMGAFALIFIPPWLAFRRAGSWCSGLFWSFGIGLSAYLLAFVFALWLDQPFGPILAILLVVLGLVVA